MLHLYFVCATLVLNLCYIGTILVLHWSFTSATIDLNLCYISEIGAIIVQHYGAIIILD